MLEMKAYGIDPYASHGFELSSLLKKFTFHVCGMRHEASGSPENADISAKACKLRDGYNLGCAHPSFNFKESPIRLMEIVLSRLEYDRVISKTESKELSETLKRLHRRVYVLDVLKRNSQQWRMDLFPNWKEFKADLPQADIGNYKNELKNLPDGSLLKGIFERLFESLKVRQDASGRLESYVVDDPTFQLRIRIGQIIASSDLRKFFRDMAIVSELALDPKIGPMEKRKIKVLSPSERGFSLPTL